MRMFMDVVVPPPVRVQHARMLSPPPRVRNCQRYCMASLVLNHTCQTKGSVVGAAPTSCGTTATAMRCAQLGFFVSKHTVADHACSPSTWLVTPDALLSCSTARAGLRLSLGPVAGAVCGEQVDFQSLLLVRPATSSRRLTARLRTAPSSLRAQPVAVVAFDTR